MQPKSLFGLAGLAACRPPLELQSAAMDCGYVCVSAVLSYLGRPTAVSQIKRDGGLTSRGLTLRQVRDLLQAYGVEADAVRFDRRCFQSYPCPGVILLKKGHYVFIASREGKWAEIYDPALGWVRRPFNRLRREVTGTGVRVPLKSPNLKVERPNQSRLFTSIVVKTYLSMVRDGGWKILAFSGIGQLLILAMPLLSMAIINSFTQVETPTTSYFIALAFLCLSLTNSAIAAASAVTNQLGLKKVALKVGHTVFDRLTGKSHGWFEHHDRSVVLNKINSIDGQISFYNEICASIGGLIITFICGMIAVILISPWLLLPAAISIAINLSIELAFSRLNSETFAEAVDAQQNKQSFVMNVLCQIPLLARYGTIKQGRDRYKGVIRKLNHSEIKTLSTRQLKSSLITIARSLETLLFISLSALFVLKSNNGLGLFVAAGAYKDLLSSSVNTVIQFHQRSKYQQIYRLQAGDLIDTEYPSSESTFRDAKGKLEFSNVCFKYGTLDKFVFENLSFKINRGECLLICGQSGIGKSTIAKLICGVLSATSGQILLDDNTLPSSMGKFGAILQTDRLIPATLRENILLFRKGISDEAIFDALKLAELFDFVSSLPMGLNTLVGEDATGLSEGQKQRVKIARALVGGPALLVFDEATSALDIKTEDRIMENIRMAGPTIVFISHRPEASRFADYVLSMDHGRITSVSTLTLSRSYSDPNLRKASND
jgi:ATP-binding cassette, subfamily B, bacterial CvaB/MchF/RaxB